MKKIVLSLFVALVAFGAKAQTWNVDKAHSSVTFNITHMMLSEVNGKFKKYDASFTSSKEDFSDAVFTLTADIASIDTDNSMRDGHLQGEKFFDAEKNPKLTFKSTSLKKLADKKFEMKGNLTMKGITKPATMMLTITGPITDARSGKPKVGIKVTGTIDRTLWTISDMPEAALSNEVEIKAAGEFMRE